MGGFPYSPKPKPLNNRFRLGARFRGSGFPYSLNP